MKAFALLGALIGLVWVTRAFSAGTVVEASACEVRLPEARGTIALGSVVRTESREAILSFGSGTALRLAPESVLRVIPFPKIASTEEGRTTAKIEVLLERGTVSCLVGGKGAKLVDLLVRTPQGVVAARTAFFAVRADGRTLVAVSEGKAQFCFGEVGTHYVEEGEVVHLLHGLVGEAPDLRCVVEDNGFSGFNEVAREDGIIGMDDRIGGRGIGTEISSAQGAAFRAAALSPIIRSRLAFAVRP
ncbi:MAG TPA: FecR domain-containing protein [Candidatus Methylacidiphilales bacterium]